jgi:hypothetical protein
MSVRAKQRPTINQQQTPEDIARAKFNRLFSCPGVHKRHRVNHATIVSKLDPTPGFLTLIDTMKLMKTLLVI